MLVRLFSISANITMIPLKDKQYPYFPIWMSIIEVRGRQLEKEKRRGGGKWSERQVKKFNSPVELATFKVIIIV